MNRFVGDLLNVPNTMSLLRVLAAPTLALFWLGLDWKVTALVLGTILGVTDLFDGIVARKLNQVTELGALIDQLGDLVFESTCLLIGVIIGEIWAGLLVVYLFREFTVTIARGYVLGHGGELPSTVMGKAKSSFLQYAFFLFFLGGILLEPGAVPDSWSLAGVHPGRMLIWASMCSILTGFAMSLISGWVYMRAFGRFYAGRTERSGR